MTKTGGPFLAGHGPGIGINAEFQPDGVYVVCDGLHSIREPLRINDDGSVRVSRDLPTIVNHDVLIPGILHARLDHGVCHAAHQFIAHIAGALIPGVPSHGRRECQAFGHGVLLREECPDHL